MNPEELAAATEVSKATSRRGASRVTAAAAAASLGAHPTLNKPNSNGRMMLEMLDELANMDVQSSTPTNAAMAKARAGSLALNTLGASAAHRSTGMHTGLTPLAALGSEPFTQQAPQGQPAALYGYGAQQQSSFDQLGDVADSVLADFGGDMADLPMQFSPNALHVLPSPGT